MHAQKWLVHPTNESALWTAAVVIATVVAIVILVLGVFAVRAI